MKVFISHSHKDEALATKVVTYLEAAGLDAWYDKREIMPGDNWAEKIAKGLRESDAGRQLGGEDCQGAKRI
jgi:hypothetical protein